MAKAQEVKIAELSPNDIIIALMGPTGAGMSTFVNVATGHDAATVGHGLHSFTTDFRAVRVFHPTTGRPIVFVDTPGFDDLKKSDSEILKLLKQKSKTKLAGIIYLYRISDNRNITYGTPFRNLGMFADLCGEDAIRNVILATTMWNQVNEEIGKRREDELKGKYWKTMLENGSVTIRFLDSYKSTWDIVDIILDRNRQDRKRDEIALPVRKGTEIAPAAGPVIVPPSNLQLQRISPSEISNSDLVILLFGSAGAGKSTFINAATSSNEMPIGHSLTPCTTEIHNVRLTHPTNRSRNIVFVDTPAPCGELKPDSPISKWMDACYFRRKGVDGILFLHKISDYRMTESLLAHLKTFEVLCGPDYPRKTLLVTTQWDMVSQDRGQMREDELNSKYWKSMIARGSNTTRFDNTTESAWRVVDYLLSCRNPPVMGENRIMLPPVATLNESIQSAVDSVALGSSIVAGTD